MVYPKEKVNKTNGSSHTHFIKLTLLNGGGGKGFKKREKCMSKQEQVVVNTSRI